jgi:hypothetical protein
MLWDREAQVGGDTQKLLWGRTKTRLGSEEDAEKVKHVTPRNLEMLHNLIWGWPQCHRCLHFEYTGCFYVLSHQVTQRQHCSSPTASWD